MRNKRCYLLNEYAMFRAAAFFILVLVQAIPASGQFSLQGQATHMDQDCILLTADSAYAEGLAFYTTPLNLDVPFRIGFDIFFGEKEEGADGITFMIHNDPRGLNAFGTWGECMGYGRWNPGSPYGTCISPSVAIEFDTYQNLRQNDPAHDHIAWLENGSSRHSTYWPQDNPDFNLEDNRLHDFVFSWNPADNRITVLLDGNVVVNTQRDLKNEIFNGASEVIWGFSASTGRKHNLQYFCLRRLARNNSPAESPEK